MEGNKSVLFGGDFPLFKPDGRYLISSKINLLIYLIQKRIFKQTDISVRNKALIRFFQSNKIDVVLAEYGMVGASIYKACKAAKVPLVIHFHGADAHHKPTIAKYINRYKDSFMYASNIMAVSQFMADALIALGAPKEKLILNPYGVNLDEFKTMEKERTPLTLLFVGRFVEKKSPDILIKAFAKVKKQVPEAHLIMAGEGPLWTESKLLATQLGLIDDIEFPGVYTHQRVKEEMQNVRAFVQHSVVTADGDCEGTPNSILEASASGLPVISTYHAGIREAVIHQKTGLLCNERDIDSFAENMIAVLENENYAKELGRNGAQHIRLNYNLKSRISNLDVILKNAINKK
nr:glycosyltransferase [uncultured Pedobacter sp.]